MSRKPEKDILDERSLKLFSSLVERFIEDGQPVGSRTLAKDSGLNLSPATIRNVMADLEDFGLLTSPHTSAGRIPTAKGYRLFVDSLLHVKALDSNEVNQISEQLTSGKNISHLLHSTSSALSELTQLASVIMLPKNEQQSLRHVEFLPISENRVLVILVINDEEVQNRIIQTEKKFSPAELTQAANFINSRFVGKTLDQMRAGLMQEMQELKDNVNKIMQLAIEMTQPSVNTGSSKSDDLLMSGHTHLMGVDDLSDVEKLKALFESFNDKRDILHLLEQSIHARGVQLFIGEESGYEVLDNCSIVTSPYESNGEVIGVLGVIGPTRMNYQRIIPIVDITAKMLGSVLNSQK